MKNLDLNQMESLEGGKFRWECAGLALMIGVSIVDGAIPLAIYLGIEFAQLGCQND